MTASCKTCRFWDVYDDPQGLKPGTLGDCRRRAPLINTELLKRTMHGPNVHNPWDDIEHTLYIPSAFPVTAKESWCGEYDARPDVAAPCGDVVSLRDVA